MKRTDTGLPLKDPQRENFCQVLFSGFVQPWEAYQRVFDPEKGRSKRGWTTGGTKLMANEAIIARLKTLYSARAAATINEAIIDQNDVLRRMVNFTDRMKELKVTAQEAKGIDMLAKATGVYKAPEKIEKPRERTDEELLAAAAAAGFTIDRDTPNRTDDGSSRRAQNSEASDVQPVPKATGVPSTRVH